MPLKSTMKGVEMQTRNFDFCINHSANLENAPTSVASSIAILSATKDPIPKHNLMCIQNYKNRSMKLGSMVDSKDDDQDHVPMSNHFQELPTLSVTPTMTPFKAQSLRCIPGKKLKIKTSTDKKNFTSLIGDGHLCRSERKLDQI